MIISRGTSAVILLILLAFALVGCQKERLIADYNYRLAYMEYSIDDEYIIIWASYLPTSCFSIYDYSFKKRKNKYILSFREGIGDVECSKDFVWKPWGFKLILNKGDFNSETDKIYYHGQYLTCGTEETWNHYLNGRRWYPEELDNDI